VGYGCHKNFFTPHMARVKAYNIIEGGKEGLYVVNKHLFYSMAKKKGSNLECGNH